MMMRKNPKESGSSSPARVELVVASREHDHPGGECLLGHRHTSLPFLGEEECHLEAEELPLEAGEEAGLGTLPEVSPSVAVTVRYTDTAGVPAPGESLRHPLGLLLYRGATLYPTSMSTPLRIPTLRNPTTVRGSTDMSIQRLPTKEVREMRKQHVLLT